MIKKYTGLLIVLLVSIQSFAQRNNISPYSFFGIGEETNQKTVEEMSMGQIGTAFNSTYRFTFSNPAALASLRFTSYTIGGQNITLKVDDGKNSGTASTAGLSYLALGFPLGNKAGFSFGLQPNSTVGYSLTREIKDNADNLIALNSYKGEGGTNRVFLGFGYQPHKNINIGAEVAYIFGNIENTLLNRRDNVQFATMHETDASIKGFTAKIGMQYFTKVTDKLTLKTGAVIHLSNKLSTDGNEYLFSLLNAGGGIVNPRDTIVNRSFKNTINSPNKIVLSTGIGAENKWYAGIEYSFRDAIEFTDGVLNKNTSISYGKSNRLSFGGFYTPKFNSITSYWQRVTYRGGFNLKQTGLIVKSKEINDFGISFGVGLPIGQQLSNLNLGFELGKRGEINNDLVKENYINFRLSLTLNDKWFKKRKIY